MSSAAQKMLILGYNDIHYKTRPLHINISSQTRVYESKAENNYGQVFLPTSIGVGKAGSCMISEFIARYGGHQRFTRIYI